MLSDRALATSVAAAELRAPTWSAATAALGSDESEGGRKKKKPHRPRPKANPKPKGSSQAATPWLLPVVQVAFSGGSSVAGYIRCQTKKVCTGLREKNMQATRTAAIGYVWAER